MYAAIGYDRRSIRSVVRIVPDMFNNVNRMCTYGRSERVWKIRTAMQDQNHSRWYLIENVKTGEKAITPVERLHYLY